MRSVNVLQHTQSEFLGQVEDHLEGRGIRFEYVRPFAGGKIPGTAAHSDGLFLLGGGPWGSIGAPLLPTLSAEIRLTKEYLARKRPVVGFGLGAQILCLAAGGVAAEADLRFSVGEARRVDAEALGGHLPERFPYALFMRDRLQPPSGARVLAVDEAGEPAVFQIGDKCLGFAGHPGCKPGMIEDLLMEFDDAPADAAAALASLRARAGALLEALVPIMTGVVKITGLMQPYDERELARRQVIPIQRG